MQYVIAAVCVLLCAGVLIFGVKVLKESRSMTSRRQQAEDEEDEIRRLRP